VEAPPKWCTFCPDRLIWPWTHQWKWCLQNADWAWAKLECQWRTFSALNKNKFSVLGSGDHMKFKYWNT